MFPKRMHFYRVNFPLGPKFLNVFDVRTGQNYSQWHKNQNCSSKNNCEKA